MQIHPVYRDPRRRGQLMALLASAFPSLPVKVDAARALGFDWTAAPVDVVADDLGPRVTGSPVQFVDTFPFDGRARLVDPIAGVPSYVPVPRDRPLTLISEAARGSFSAAS